MSKLDIIGNVVGNNYLEKYQIPIDKLQGDCAKLKSATVSNMPKRRYTNKRRSKRKY